MKHFATPQFWEHYEKLPSSVRDLADKNFELLKADPKHPSLRLKKVGQYWSARVGRKYRSLAVDTSDGLIWFWIGRHGNYDKVLRR